MFCHNCGTKLAEGTALCSNCGGKQTIDVATTKKEASHEHPASTPKNTSSPFAVGEIAYAKWEDGSFYECEILKLSNTTAKVKFIDDGIVSKVSLSDIRTSHEEPEGGSWRNFIGTNRGKGVIVVAILFIIGFFIVPNITQGPTSGGHGEYISFTVEELRNLMQYEYNIYRRYVHGNPIALTGQIAETSNRTLSLQVPSSGWAAAIETSSSIRRTVSDNYFRGDFITIFGIADMAMGNIPYVRRATNNRPPNATIVTLSEIRRRTTETGQDNSIPAEPPTTSQQTPTTNQSDSDTGILGSWVDTDRNEMTLNADGTGEFDWFTYVAFPFTWQMENNRITVDGIDADHMNFSPSADTIDVIWNWGDISTFQRQ